MPPCGQFNEHHPYMSDSEFKSDFFIPYLCLIHTHEKKVADRPKRKRLQGANRGFRGGAQLRIKGGKIRF